MPRNNTGARAVCLPVEQWPLADAIAWRAALAPAADPVAVQALPLGMDHARRFWRQRQALRRAIPRADVEDAAVEQPRRIVDGS